MASCGRPNWRRHDRGTHLGFRRKEAAMVKYREVEDAWERKHEEQESSKKIAAAKKKVEQEVKVRQPGSTKT